MRVFSLPAPCSCRLGRAVSGGIEICERSVNVALQLSQTRYPTLSDHRPGAGTENMREMDRESSGARGACSSLLGIQPRILSYQSTVCCRNRSRSGFIRGRQPSWHVLLACCKRRSVAVSPDSLASCLNWVSAGHRRSENCSAYVKAVGRRRLSTFEI